MTTRGDHPIRVVTVDHSPVGRERLRRLCAGASDMRVVGEVTDAGKAASTVAQLRADIVVVDYDLPKGAGLAVVRDLLATAALPVIMVIWTPAADAAAREAKALEAGAVAFVDASPKLGKDTAASTDQALLRLLRTMSEVKVVHRRRGRLTESLEAGRAARSGGSLVAAGEAVVVEPVRALEIVAFGASTGGPPAIQTILTRLPRPFPLPILLAQHMTPGFQVNFTQWLRESTGVRVHLAEHGMVPRPGEVYVAPDTQHMGVDTSKRIVLSPDPPENGSRPSVSFLFRSVAKVYGAATAAVLLTGMGRDGARELRQLRDLGAVTIAQDEESSVVHGMPGEAIKLRAARYIVPPEKVADILAHLVRRPRTAAGSERAATAGKGS